MFERVMRQARVAEELLKARLEVDMAGLVAGMRARLEAALPLESLPLEGDLADRQGPIGWGRVRTFAWQAPKLRKIVLSHVSFPPMIDGFAVVLLPNPILRCPIFAADLMALPTRISVNADWYGMREVGASSDSLAPLQENFARLRNRPGPSWAAPIASGEGLHGKISLRLVEDAFGAVTTALGCALEMTQKAPEGTSNDGLQSQFFQLFHDHGPRKGPLGYLLGQAWAERYSRLIFQ
jgi:hypothetical protein